ncbi:hypothetical protein QZH41_001769 [Actinostola sp. cb2023]|nr:hypothetical protein QZH41_001769 [Actinostola sp. cb2023]
MIEELLAQGVDFRTYMYVPEVDPVTGDVYHEREDHCHILKRIWKHTRECGPAGMNLNGFDDAMLDPENGYASEATYVQTVAGWHEAADGRGITELERCKRNYTMLNMILDEWMPWHRTTYDFATIDINKEFCKRMNPDIPFYYCTRNERYMAFDHDLPSFNERPHNDDDDSDDDSDDVSDDDSDDGDDDPQQHPLRLHRLVINRREDASIFVSGRSFLPARNQGGEEGSGVVVLFPGTDGRTDDGNDGDVIDGRTDDGTDGGATYGITDDGIDGGIDDGIDGASL